MKDLFTVLFSVMILAGCITQTPPASREADGALPVGAFRSVALPKVERLPSASKDALEIIVVLDSNGIPSINGIKYSLKVFDSLLAKIRRENPGRSLPVNIGADANTPFDKVWPFLLTCCSNEVWIIGYAVSTGDQKYVAFLKAFSVVPPANALDRRPLDINAGEELPFSVIRLQTNGLMIAHYSKGFMIEQERVGDDVFQGRMRKLGEINNKQAVIIAPSQGASYGDVVRALYWCHRGGLKNISLVREDALNVLVNKKE